MADNPNLDLWRQLGKTDPDQVKDFQRAGGFRGHAVKPIYVIQKMTQIFGPCGVGWIIGRPDFTTVATDDGLVSVHCTVEVSVKLPGTDQMSAPIFGVGGDHAVASRKSGKFVDDEAFKKAYTDAIGNALKFLGMSADIHMGRFEDSKYVASLRDEKNEAREARRNGDGRPAGGGYQSSIVKEREQGPPPCEPDDTPPHDPETGEVQDESVIVTLDEDEQETAATAKEAANLLAGRMKDASYFQASRMLQWNYRWIMTLPKSWQDRLEKICNDKQEEAKAAGENYGAGRAA